jgi:hypothetical protein
LVLASAAMTLARAQAVPESSTPALDATIAGAPRPRPYTFDWRTNPDQTYRTICVRLCDGFYYPVSEASTPANFVGDEQRCQSSCASPTKLFYARPGEDVDQMVALTGEGYAGLPNAFLYRSEYVQACACKTKPSNMEAKAAIDQGETLATRTEGGSIMADAASETAKILPSGDVKVVRAKAKPAASKQRYNRAAAEKARMKSQLRASRYYAGVPVAPPQASYAPPPQRRFFLFGSRY